MITETIKQEHAFRSEATPVMLIIPDVHGRTFWKKAVESHPSLPVVFLGDYLDPYHNCIEDISAAEAIPNFAEILSYKNSNSDRVTLLLGNHDLHYLYPDMDCSRKDYCHSEEIMRMFTENFDCFQLTLSMHQAGRTFVFSHAGIIPGWLDMRLQDIDKADINAICTALNEKLHIDPTFTRTIISDASYYRWGPAKFGSPVWADIDEHGKEGPLALPEDVIQIFGHTQQEEGPVYRQGYCCLDCRRAFLLTSEGKIMECA